MSEPKYQAYSAHPPATDEQIREWFKTKFGYQAEEIKRSAGAVLAGPLRKTND